METPLPPPRPSPLILYMYKTLHPQNQRDDPKMPILRRSKEEKRRPRPDGRCKKHPKHQQSPGVCSVCLNEKLSRLSTHAGSSHSSWSSSTKKGFSSSSSSSCSYYSSASSDSSCTSSPMHRYRYPYTTEGKGSLILFLTGKKNNLLARSRSVAFGPSGTGNETKKGGFWSKLLPSRSKRRDQEELMHSRTTRERMIITT